MITPAPVGSAVAGAKIALNLKTIAFMLVITVIVTLLMSYVLKNEIVIFDKDGNVFGKGEIKPKINFSVKLYLSMLYQNKLFP